jgi:two-component system LytT family response regulator
LITTLIADDEMLARQGLRVRLEREPDIEVIGETIDGPTTVAAIKSQQPDLVFLDVRMPVFDGFEVLKRVAFDYLPSVVFVTAYDQHAIQAFDVHALDYVLKPIDPARLHEALRRVRHHLATEAALASAHGRVNEAVYGGDGHAQPAERPQAKPHLLRLVVKDIGRFCILPADEVDWIDSAANYVQLHSRGRCLLHRTTMIELERQLDSRRFVRIHRKAIVNVDRVREMLPLEHGDYSLILHDGTKLRLSRSWRNQFFSRVNARRFGTAGNMSSI